MSLILQSSNKRNINFTTYVDFSAYLARMGAIIQNVMTLLMVLSYFKAYWGNEREQFNSILFRMNEDYVTNKMLKLTVT